MEWVRVKCKYIIPKLLFDSNCDVCHIGHHFHEFFCQCMHDLDYDLWNGPRSNVNMPIKNPYMTCYLMVIVFFFYRWSLEEEVAARVMMSLQNQLLNITDSSVVEEF